MIDEQLSVEGVNPQYGASPVSAHPGGEPFDPPYVMGVWISVASDPAGIGVHVRHGFKPVPAGSSRDDRQQLAQSIIDAAKSHSTGRWYGNDDGRADPSGVWFMRENFEDFGSRTEVEVYYALDSEFLSWDDRLFTDADNSCDNLVRFTPLTTVTMPGGKAKYEPTRANDAFYGAAITKKGGLLRIENWFTDATPDGKPREYSMNIGLMMETTNGAKLPVILDPDTGNGQGNGPPPDP